MTPIRINLMPHRQMRRARAQRLFTALIALSAGVGVAVVAAGQFWITSEQKYQEQRNAYLKEAIAKLDKQIQEISQLKQKTEDLLARKDVVESLQANRGDSVRLFDELAKTVPEGLYLKSLKQVGDGITIVGYAQSSARVSTFMRALEATNFFQAPSLVEVKAADVGKQRLNEFTLSVRIERAAEAGKQAAASGKGGKG